MTDTPRRLLTLLSLLQTPREWPGSELAERLGVSARTVRRDIDRLRELGYPVEASMGMTGGYRLASGRAMPPLLLDDEEAVAIAVGLRTAAGDAISGIEEASVRALTKLEQVLPSRLRARVRAVGGSTVRLPSPGPTVDPATLTTLAAAIANTERARFGYIAGDGGRSSRHVEPHGLVSTGNRWYLVAFDLNRDDWRTFRADRITTATATGARSTQRRLPAEGPAAFLTNRRNALAPTYRAEVTLDLPAARVRERFRDAPAEIEEIAPGRCRVLSHTDTLGWLAFRLLMLDCEFQVHGPPELITHLRELRGRAARAVD